MNKKSDSQSKNRQIDFGYPTPARGKVPAFKSLQEEMEFWDTHDTVDFADDLSEATYTPAKKDAPITIRLDFADRTRLKAEAEKMGIGPSTLARIWIKERLAG
ncbi:MAG TPA: CopG family antitoxin [Thermomicrobiales bacterium]|nr:CopG family antitoxin [Thermomicrobiales bacterium]